MSVFVHAKHIKTVHVVAERPLIIQLQLQMLNEVKKCFYYEAVENERSTLYHNQETPKRFRGPFFIF